MYIPSQKLCSIKQKNQKLYGKENKSYLVHHTTEKNVTHFQSKIREKNLDKFDLRKLLPSLGLSTPLHSVLFSGRQPRAQWDNLKNYKIYTEQSRALTVPHTGKISTSSSNRQLRVWVLGQGIQVNDFPSLKSKYQGAPSPEILMEDFLSRR